MYDHTSYMEVPFLNSYDTKTPRCPGIYRIVNRRLGKFYVGSTNNLKTRRRRHVADLRIGKHDNCNLQDLFNYDPNDFLFYYRATDTEKEAKNLEQQELDEYYKKGRLLNIAIDARSSFKGRKKTIEQRLAQSQRMMDHSVSDETKEKISNTLKEHERPDHIIKNLQTVNIGRVQTDTHRAALSDAKANPVVIYGIEYHNQSIAAKELGKTRSTIASFIKNPNYKDCYLKSNPKK